MLITGPGDGSGQTHVLALTAAPEVLHRRGSEAASWLEGDIAFWMANVLEKSQDPSQVQCFAKRTPRIAGGPPHGYDLLL